MKTSEIQNAQTLVAQLSSQYNYTQNHADEFAAYQQLFALKTQIMEDGRNWEQLSASEIADLEAIAAGTNADASVQAHNILRFATNHVYDVEPIFPQDTPQ